MNERSLADLIHQACLMEATARKPGNVHPEASFDDLTYDDFVRSADIVAPILASAEDIGVGRAILESVQATREALGRNSNLGIILLLAPLAAVPRSVPLRQGIGAVLQAIDLKQTQEVYDAIRLAAPGGMGEVEEGDVSQAPPFPLLEAMNHARERDAIALEYVTDFALTTGQAATIVASTAHHDWELRVIHLHLWFLARRPDTLIARKCGIDVAEEAQGWAQHLFAEGWPETDGSVRLQRKFDRWLREDGHRRNPGATADLIAAALFAALREGKANFPDWPGRALPPSAPDSPAPVPSRPPAAGGQSSLV